MERISVFDMLKIGVGPSSSHTLGPWRAAERWIYDLKESGKFDEIVSVKVDLYGSLSLTGIGHATDLAVMLGLSGTDPVTIPVDQIDEIISNIKQTNTLSLGDERAITFSPKEQIVFNKDFLPFHANGITFSATLYSGNTVSNTYYSIGGGFVVEENEETPNLEHTDTDDNYPYPVQRAKELLDYSIRDNKSISEIVMANEMAVFSQNEIDEKLHHIWQTMLECMYIGCHTEGFLPGGLNVRRRAFDLHKKLKKHFEYTSPEEWMHSIRDTEVKFREILRWVDCYALAVNEVNASLGRVVTAPTNGSAGVIPAVLMYYLTIENHDGNFEHVKKFLLVAGEIGSLFKKNATISAAMGGCQAEIGVSSAMAAAALCELLGGTPAQVLIAAEIAMEHHLGLTCDPIGGLVQIPCIERNSMGAIKAINAAELALEQDPAHVKVPLDKVIDTMWETAQNMNTKYKETSEGGLAVAVNIADC